MHSPTPPVRDSYEPTWTDAGLPLPPAQHLPASVATAVLHALRRSRLCRGIDARQLEQVADGATYATFNAGQTICHQGDSGVCLYVVAGGRVQLSVQRKGAFRMLNYVGKGDHFGELALLTDGRYSATATAMVDTQLVTIDRPHFQHLLTTAPLFAANISRSLGFQLRWETSGRTHHYRPKLVAIAHSTLQTQRLLRPLAEALARRDESIVVLTDRPHGPVADGDYAIERINPELVGDDRLRHLRARIVRLSESNDRVILDLRQQVDLTLVEILADCEVIYWLCEPNHVDTSAETLRALLTHNAAFAARVHWVWALGAGERFAPLIPSDLKLADPDFKVAVGTSSVGSARLQQGIARIVRNLSGIKLGLALSGGGARGLAHLGVLAAFDEAGIDFDLLAGTSSGALMAASYAAGFTPTDALRHFTEDLKPHWFWRHIPRGGQWYLWTMFHMGAWDSMLRRYMGDHYLEQLQLPLSIVTVDLVSGSEVVRDRGDIVNAVRESINIPLVSKPILRDGMALVDGGVLNNLPGDVLVRRGANLVVGVDVMARLSRSFAGNTPETPTEQMRLSGPLDCLLRVNEVQDKGISALRSSNLDLVIAPDAAEFPFSDFTRGVELAQRGAAAAREAIPQLKQLLAEVDSD